MMIKYFLIITYLAHTFYIDLAKFYSIIVDFNHAYTLGILQLYMASLFLRSLSPLRRLLCVGSRDSIVAIFIRIPIGNL